MENFKEALIQFSRLNPSLIPNEYSYPVLIEQSFHQFFADFQTPDHPTYAAMIYRAIWELNKKRGSSEKSISKFIKKEHSNLPWAHSTLLKHHLQKLCDCNEIHMTHKQCYLLGGAESEPDKKSSGPGKKLKKQKSRLGSKAVKKISRPHKKHKKIKKCIKELRKRKMRQKLKIKKKSNKRVKKRAIEEQIKHQLSNEGNLKQDNDESHEQKQMLEVNTGDIQIQEQNDAGQESHHDNSGVKKEKIGLNERKRKRKHQLKLKRKSSKRVKKHAISEEINLKQVNDESHNTNEAGQESDHDNSGHVNLEQIHTEKNPELLQPEESPDSNRVSHKNSKRVLTRITRSQLKIISKKDASDKSAIVENLSNEEQQISTSPSSEKPLVELLKSISSKLTRLPDDEPTTGQSSTEKSTVEDKPLHKRRGRPPKLIKHKKDDVLGNSKSAAILRKCQKSAKKGKVVNKKVQPKQKRDMVHMMTRRSNRKPSN